MLDNVAEKKKKIKVLVIDVDGTLTDGKLYIGATGELFKRFDVKDGSGIHDILPLYSILPVVVTGRSSEIVVKRCDELEISHVYQGCRDKENTVEMVAQNFGFLKHDNKYDEIAYIGDDLIDLGGMRLSGISGCPSDSALEVKRSVDFICNKKGGEGAVREFIEWLVHNGLNSGEKNE